MDNKTESFEKEDALSFNKNLSFVVFQRKASREN